MLTRIEVDGFKNLLGFSAEFGPFTCIAGPNAVGKSNLFDAIEFLSLLADLPVKDAARRIRGGGEVRDLFYTDGKQRVDRMRFAVEMLTEAVITDDRGLRSDAAPNFYRYDLELELETSNELDASRPVVAREYLESVPKRLRFPGGHLMDTKGWGFHYQSGRHRPPRTFISTVTTLDSNGVSPPLNVRREMQSWRRLALDPAALRGSDSIDDLEEDISPEGAHLPAMIYRLAHESHDGNPPDPEGFYAQLAVRLSELLSIRSLHVDRDDKDRRLHLQTEMLDGSMFPARALSDGTLRFLALAALSFVRKQRLLCIEEPENGVHPSRMSALVDLVRELATNPEFDLEYEDTVRQVIVNTHSPDFVQSVYQDASDAILVATQAMIPGPFNTGARVLRLDPLNGTWRCSPENPGIGVLPLMHYLRKDIPPHT